MKEPEFKRFGGSVEGRRVQKKTRNGVTEITGEDYCYLRVKEYAFRVKGPSNLSFELVEVELVSEESHSCYFSQSKRSQFITGGIIYLFHFYKCLRLNQVQRSICVGDVHAKAFVGAIVNNLVQKGLLEKSGKGESSVLRRTKKLERLPRDEKLMGILKSRMGR